MKSISDCALKTKSESWDTINWKLAQQKVKTLQLRIAKAIREDKHGKAKSLQWILTHSYYAKALAIKKVTSNSGKKNTWSRWNSLEIFFTKTKRYQNIKQASIQGATSAQNIHSQEKWKTKTIRDSYHKRQSVPSSAPARS